MENSAKLALGKTLKWLGVLFFFFSAFCFYKVSTVGDYSAIGWLILGPIFFIAWPPFLFGGRGLMLRASGVPLKGPSKTMLGIFAVIVVVGMITLAIISLGMN